MRKVKYVQFIGNFGEIEKFVGGDCSYHNGILTCATREEAMKIKNGDFVIQREDGTFYTKSESSIVDER